MKKKLGLGCLTLVLITALAAGVYAYRLRLYHDSVMTRLENVAMPVSYGALADAYPVQHDETNAADHYENAARAFEAAAQELSEDERTSLRDPGSERYTLGQPWSESDLKTCKAFFADNAEMLDSALAITAMPHCRFLVESDPVTGPDTGAINQVRTVVRYLSIEAAVSARDGRPEDALRALEAIGRAAEQLKVEPFLMGQMVYSATVYTGVRTAMDVAKTGALDDDMLRLLPVYFAANDFKTTVRSAFSGEMVMSLENPTFGNFIGRNMLMNLVDWELRFVEAADAPLPEALKQWHAVQADFDTGKGVGTLAAIAVNPFIHTSATFARPIAETAVLDALCAIERYRLANGKAPYSLDALVPDYAESVPVDPFDGKEIRYLAVPNYGGFVLYSIGPNLTDDNGELDPSGRTGDIGVEVAP